MIRKRVLLVGKRDDQELAEFDEHWATRHPEVVCRMQGLVGYVQHRVVAPEAVPGIDEAPSFGRVDGIVEIWADDSVKEPLSREDFVALRADEAAFLGSLTGFNVPPDDSGSHPDPAADSWARIWILADQAVDLTLLKDTVEEPFDAWVPQAGALITRRDITHEPSAPGHVVSIGATEDQAAIIYRSVVAAMTRALSAEPIRVVLTHTRRIV